MEEESSHMMTLQPDQKAALNCFPQQKGEAMLRGEKMKTYYTVLYDRKDERFGGIQLFFNYQNLFLAWIRKLELVHNNKSPFCAW